MINVNCIYNDQGAWCTNEKIKRSLFGIDYVVVKSLMVKVVTLFVRIRNQNRRHLHQYHQSIERFLTENQRRS